MNNLDQKKSKRKKHPIRNFFTSVVLIAVLFLAALFGNIFPGLNDFRDSLLEKQAYTETVPDDSAKMLAQEQDEIIIQEYEIYYKGETVTLTDLSAQLDTIKTDTITLSDYQGSAKQQTWQDVSQLLNEKGFAVNENIIP